MRLEEIELRCAEHFLARLVAPGLRDHPRLERHLRRVVGVVGIVGRVAEHERWLHRPDHTDEPELVVLRQLEGIVAEVERDEIVDAERLRCFLRLRPARGLDPVDGHARLLPELRAIAALAEGEADDGDLVALRGMQRDRAAAAPDEVGGVGADDKGGPAVGHLGSSGSVTRVAGHVARPRRQAK
jgi:hypothetical protein